MTQCLATAKSSGKRCGRSAILGGTVCVVHGGSAPQVKAKARARILSLVDPAIGILAHAVRKRKQDWYEPTAVDISAVREILRLAGIADPDPGSSRDDGATWEEFLTVYRRPVLEHDPE